jgi:hypothetical protein
MSASAIQATTFKPYIDRAAASDGASVAVWANEDGLILLTFREGRWVFSRHRNDICGPIRWRGVRYSAAGEPVQGFDALASIQDWEAFYDDCYGGEASPVGPVQLS